MPTVQTAQPCERRVVVMLEVFGQDVAAERCGVSDPKALAITGPGEGRSWAVRQIRKLSQASVGVTWDHVTESI